jgi:aryl-alcohol dehydrogenase-like predicted oxidoreductase
VYDRRQVVEVSKVFPFEIIQLPINLADQRLLRDGTLRELRSRGVEIHVRSAFLQGALLLEADEVPAGMDRLNPALAELKRRSAESGVSPVHALLGFALDLAEVDAVVVGVNCAAQLEELCRFSQQPLPTNFDRSPLPVSDEDLLNPGTWKRRINI